VKLAVFDVCGTLYDSNTTFDFLAFVFQYNKKYLIFQRLNKMFLFKAVNYISYRYFHYDIVRIIATYFLKGKSVDEIENLASRFVDEYLVDKKIHYVHSLLSKYQDRGYKVVLFSGSYEIVVKQIAKKLGVDAFYASKLKQKGAVLSGVYDKDILFDKKSVLKEAYWDVEELIVVSDNRTDYPLFEMATKAIIVVKTDKMRKYWHKSNLNNMQIVGYNG